MNDTRIVYIVGMGHIPDIVSGIMQHSPEDSEEMSVKMKLSANKMDLIIFMRKRRLGNFRFPMLNNTVLAPLELVKYLGKTLHKILA